MYEQNLQFQLKNGINHKEFKEIHKQTFNRDVSKQEMDIAYKAFIKDYVDDIFSSENPLNYRAQIIIDKDHEILKNQLENKKESIVNKEYLKNYHKSVGKKQDEYQIN